MRAFFSGALVLSSLAAAALGAGCGDDTTSSGGGGSGAAGPSTGTGATSTGSSNGGGGQGSTTNGSGSSTTGNGGAGVGGAGQGGAGGGGCGSLPVISQPPNTLSATGLYSDIDSDTLAPYVREFTPKYPLWTDGATKRRWIYIPECDIIDNSDMDTWEMPVGARLWKEFTRDGVRVETRMIVRTGPNNTDFKFAAYQWQGTEAFRVPNGVVDANGTGHDIPAESLCSTCHRKDWRVLGFSAIQLSHGGAGETMATLSNAGLLSNPLPGGVQIPGNATEQAALGYLHSNCGSCHYSGGIPNISMHLKVKSTDATVMGTDTYTTAVNVLTTQFQCNGCDRIEPGDSAASAVFQRMSIRGGMQMPPYATEIVDAPAVAAVGAWIDSL